MAEVKKIATRESYGNALVELGQENPNVVVLDADLAAATKTGMFKKAFPERHIDRGIAECNMIGIAAGLAAAGMTPFASSFAMFAAGRAFEQVRNSVGYPHLNVKIDFRAFRLILNCSVFITIIIMSVLEPLFDELIRSYNQQLSAGSPGLLSLLEGLSPLFHDESHMIYNDNGIHSLLNVVVFVFVHLSVLPSCSSQRRQL